MKTNYSVRIYSPENLSKDWYVYIYSVVEKKIIKRFSEGLNDFTTFEDRMLQSLLIKKHLETELKSGWQPIKTLPSAGDVNSRTNSSQSNQTASNESGSTKSKTGERRQTQNQPPPPNTDNS